MTDSQNTFYSSISDYYSEIFPFNPLQLKFVNNELNALAQKNILDIGCATGELAFKLAESGAGVVGIDLNERLLQQAIANKQHDKLSFHYGNMLDLALNFAPQQFDAVLCFGNTLVHLESDAQILKMLKGANEILKPGGKLLLQVLNYDFICGKQLATLPVIDTKNIKFVRRYRFSENTDLIGFQTDLEIKAKNRIVSNETQLLALKSATLRLLLKEATFRNIQLYSNFNKDAFEGESLPLVISCTR